MGHSEFECASKWRRCWGCTIVRNTEWGMGGVGGEIARKSHTSKTHILHVYIFLLRTCLIQRLMGLQTYLGVNYIFYIRTNNIHLQVGCLGGIFGDKYNKTVYNQKCWIAVSVITYEVPFSIRYKTCKVTAIVRFEHQVKLCGMAKTGVFVILVLLVG